MSIAVMIYAVGIIINLVVDIIIFNIISSTIDSEVSYLKNVMIYTICLQTKVTILKSYGFRWKLFGIYFVIALVMIWLLKKILSEHRDKLTSVSFITIGIVLQTIIIWLMGFIIKGF